MEFEVINEYPPNIEEIRKVFDMGDRDIVFTYGVTLYNPKGNSIPHHLMVHEKVHQRQQLAMGVEEWWRKYLADEEFRLSQEIEAYREQYKFVKERVPGKIAKDFLTSITLDCCSGMYGNMVEYGKAETMIRRLT
jgi:hypothetical protein